MMSERLLKKQTDPAELRFAKQQQWYVATATVTLNAAAFALVKGTSYLNDYEVVIASFFIVVVAGAGIKILANLQSHMRTLRRVSEAKVPWSRSTDVFWSLS